MVYYFGRDFDLGKEIGFMEDWLLFGLIEFNKKLFYDLILIWVIVSLVGDFMIEFMFNEVREHLIIVESISCIDLIN